ncbi:MULTISPECIES: cupin domain-containing protein [Clostridium]|uniref:cupin domain-containing protein n=1 Tax=Clostridium TaxID=1485 RepID=UPI001A9262A2|nr:MULTISPECIES: cupin domain-containing protein [Clostridium]MBO0525557.1 cupin domain-containing protein [Clostridium botulinum]MBO0529097.1 cupin domain-containing protein [Clostridium botulinum]MBO0533649.1 cupin domain-containing protein [Clostridium botulinum]MBO0536020.1 cupin domain-containing protein [Clostridium botulinum]MBO0539639.1 cupin domain-containing protein [Clostridium botulinum]
MKDANYFIEKLDMTAHPEGGYYKESFISAENITDSDLTTTFEDKRILWTSIYFLLRNGEVSNFHRLKSDEMWYYHSGSPLTIYMITPEGEFITEQLGLDIEKGEKPQVLVPKNYIFGSAMNNKGYALVGCMVSPGFEFRDFELFERDTLLNLYPKYKETIEKLTRA